MVALLGVHSDLMAINNQLAVLGLHLAFEPTVGRIIFEQINLDGVREMYFHMTSWHTM